MILTFILNHPELLLGIAIGTILLISFFIYRSHLIEKGEENVRKEIAEADLKKAQQSKDIDDAVDSLSGDALRDKLSKWVPKD